MSQASTLHLSTPERLEQSALHVIVGTANAMAKDHSKSVSVVSTDDAEDGQVGTVLIDSKEVVSVRLTASDSEAEDPTFSSVTYSQSVQGLGSTVEALIKETKESYILFLAPDPVSRR